MRIRRRTYRLLGSAYSTPAAPPPVPLVPPQILESCQATLIYQDLDGFLSPATTPEGPCQLSRSPWDLLDDLSLSNPQEVDDLLDCYYVNMDSHTSNLSSASMNVTSMKNKETMTMTITSSDKAQVQTPKKTTLKKATMKVNKEVQTKKNTNLKKEESEEGSTQTWKCKKNDGKGWKCPRNASHPNSLCEYHLMKRRSYLNIEFASPMEEDKIMVTTPISTSKPSSSSNAEKKPANNYAATEGFHDQIKFGPPHGKRHCRNHRKNEENVELEPSKYASHLNHAKVETKDGTNNGATSGGDVCSNNNSSSVNVNMERNKNPWKPPRKPVKVRSLMSL